MMSSLPFSVSATTSAIMDQAGERNAEAGPSSLVYPSAPIYAFDAAPREVSVTRAGVLDSEVDLNFFRSARWYVQHIKVLMHG